jgi:hypothetical protein
MGIYCEFWCGECLWENVANLKTISLRRHRQSIAAFTTHSTKMSRITHQITHNSIKRAATNNEEDSNSKEMKERLPLIMKFCG